jgi:hypothetical protein
VVVWSEECYLRMLLMVVMEEMAEEMAAEITEEEMMEAETLGVEMTEVEETSKPAQMRAWMVDDGWSYDSRFSFRMVF